MLPAQVLPTIFGTKKGKIANNIKVIMVEAGGIEPPSEGLWHKAATCVVCVFSTQIWSARRQAFRIPSPFSSPSAQGAKAVGFAHPCLTPVHGADEQVPAGRGRLSSQCVRIIVGTYWFSACFTRRQTSACSLYLNCSRRTHYAPIEYVYSIDALGSQTIRADASSTISQRIWPMRM